MFPMNHFQTQLMVSSRLADSEVLRVAIQSEYFSSDRKPTGKCHWLSGYICIQISTAEKGFQKGYFTYL